ncbi:MAG: PaaI family thioesterase [bacterium]
MKEIITRIENRINSSAMAKWMNMSVSRTQDNQLLYRLGFDEAHIGNPIIRALHGGVVSSFMETAAMLEEYAKLSNNEDISVVSTHTNYLRSSKPMDMLATVSMAREGRRICFAEVNAWQESEEKPVARAAVCLRTFRHKEMA